MKQKEYQFGNLIIVYGDENIKAYSFSNKIIELDKEHITINAEFLGTGDTIHHIPTNHYANALRKFYEDTDKQFSITKAVYDKVCETITELIYFKTKQESKYLDLLVYERRAKLGDKLDEFINMTLGHHGFFSAGCNWCMIDLSRWI